MHIVVMNQSWNEDSKYTIPGTRRKGFPGKGDILQDSKSMMNKSIEMRRKLI